jgi:amino acid permease
MIQVSLSCLLYLQAKDLLNGLESISEIGYRLFGRSSIFFMNGTLLFLCLGSITIYFNIFGSICSGLMKNVTGDIESDSFFLSS